MGSIVIYSWLSMGRSNDIAIKVSYIGRHALLRTKTAFYEGR